MVLFDGGRGTFPSYVQIDPVRLAELLRGPEGGVTRELLRRGELVKVEAQRLVGVFNSPDGYTMAHRKRKPGTLKHSIVKRLADVDGEVACIVGSADPIALWHHEGTVPHRIVPRQTTKFRPGGAGGGGRHINTTKARLVFFWPRVNRVVAFPMVNHPGTKPNRFLVNALHVLPR